MSKKPPQGKGNYDKKKKGAPQMSQNELAKQEYLELDEAEIEHRKQLDEKYRDRAKERREGLVEEDDEIEDVDDEHVIIRDGDKEIFTKTKGLDLELLQKEKAKEMKDHTKTLAALEKMIVGLPGQKKEEKKENGKKKEIKCVAKSTFGMSIHRALFTEQKRYTQRNIFISNNCYEFDVNPDFGSTLPRLVIRGHNTKDAQEEKPVSLQIGPQMLERMTKTVTYIKTGKRPEPKKEDNNQPHKGTTKQQNQISTMSEEEESDDEDSIFPGAKKMVKTEQGGKPTSLFRKDESDEETKEDKERRILKGLFNSVKSAQDEGMEIEKSQDILEKENERIREKNKQYLAEISQKKAEEKLAQLQEKDKDFYMECFPTDIPKLEDLKNSQKDMGKNKGKARAKKRELSRQFDKVSKIMEEKRKGGGGKGGED